MTSESVCRTTAPDSGSRAQSVSRSGVVTRRSVGEQRDSAFMFVVDTLRMRVHSPKSFVLNTLIQGRTD